MTSAWTLRRFFGALLGLALAITAGCEEEPEVAEKPEPEAVAPAEQLILTETTFEALPGWSEDQVVEVLPALLRSCAGLTAQTDERPVGPDGLAGSVADWRAPCLELGGLAAPDETTLRGLLASWFQPYEVTGPGSAPGSALGKFTGYYEAELNGALFPGGEYRWPLFTLPPDLVRVDLGRFRADLEGERIFGRVENGRLVPYHGRAEIDDGVLSGRNLELLWVDDPVDAFFLHIQGSGQVRLPDGETLRVGFAGSNGLSFVGIGRVMIDEGKVPENGLSMQSIRDWLRANPEEGAVLMRRNPRYIFFRRIEGDGPIGSQGVALTPGRSLAVDPAFLPLGAPLWLDTTWPGSDKPLRRLMVAQDTGSAIKGPVRGDFYWGAGEAALEYAGRMNQQGRYFLLLPKTVAERRRTSS
ncbi:MAG: murein transglycosylase A [Rhodospirillales bacterium]|nr:murein transglycosylase A [Rhodospirillales bacterium]